MAISEGTRITGVFAWSILDNLEWAQGYQGLCFCSFCYFAWIEEWHKACC